MGEALPPGRIASSIEPADLLTPVAAFLKLTGRLPGAARNAFLLESIEGGAARGRYSVIGLLPDVVWRCDHGRVAVAAGTGAGFVETGEAPLASLRALIDANRMQLPDGMPPMTAGLFGYVGYDMVRQMEHLPDAPHDDLGLPEAVLLRPSLFAIFDNVRDELTLAAPLRDGATVEQGEALLERARIALALPVPHPPVAPGGAAAAEPTSNFTRDAFEDVVRRIQEYIAAGDVFQAVPSQRFSTPFAPPAIALYRALRRINPSPFLFLLDFEGFSLVGSSPEVLVRLRDGTVTVRPLAGTRPRGADPAEDRRLAAELLADPKERAEHLMLIDLGRNDVGRVAEIGSVRVTESFAIERFSHVMHISSTVQGRLKPGLTALDALVAGFPAGTLTGAPKIRAMEIIDEMEPTRRGPYAGCIGYFGADGTMDTCIGLRMAVLQGGVMHVQAGCGVVADSVPAAEYEETRQKARALLRAAEAATTLTGHNANPTVTS
ncbi:anthranilate synthase component I [Lichenicoccus roseus]|uniref:Anthranilate synthase component 1 n=1 Tax=Lichenicoccus roseus TaxID=2683649 RepID=A0A5R9J8H0_9PROT|nr:anthranilate synthase component I [Lichenicoccus roseus]TLU73895.1 anthranilate synthase component I [Lichenicoccus roseus]